MWTSVINSNLCRLCAEEYSDGYEIFEESEDKASLVILINKYLPITVINDGIYPSHICDKCHSGVAAAVDLIDRMVLGQQNFREANIQTKAGEEENSDAASILINLQGNSDPIPMDDIAKGKDPVKLYGSNHPLSHSLAGTILKRKRGRPRMSKSNLQKNCNDVTELANLESKRPRRNAAIPSRFRDSVVENSFENIEIESMTMEGSKPSITVADGVSDNNSDLPYALNIEILEHDGNFILSDIEQFSSLKRLKSNDKCNINFFDNPNVSSDCILNEQIVAISADDHLPSKKDTITLSNNQETFTLSAEQNSAALKSLNNDSNTQEGLICNDSKSLKSTGIISQSPEGGNNFFTSASEQNVNLSGDQEKLELSSNSTVDSSTQINNANEEPDSQYSTTLSKKRKLYAISAVKGRRILRKKYSHKCPICGKSFLKEGRYYHHLKLHGKVIMHCVSCKEKFDDHYKLKEHQATSEHTGIAIEEVEQNGVKDEQLRCHLCSSFRVFMTKEGYERHMSSAHGAGKPFTCEHCHKGFVYVHSLRAHLKQCSVLNEDDLAPHTKYSCEICNKVFRHLSSLNYHRDSVHNNGRVFVCSICSASFKHRQLLQRHRSVHCDDRPYECGTCLKTFKTRCNLMNHAVTHSDQKKYTCEFCGKQFSHITAITTHLKTHRGDKQFECSYCQKKFVQNGNLTEHIRIHTGEKPFHCNVCGKRFRTSSQIKLHTKVHNKTIDNRRNKNNVFPSGSINIVANNVCSQCGVTVSDLSKHKCVEINNETKWLVAENNQNNIVYLLSDDKINTQYILPATGVQLIDNSGLVASHITEDSWSTASHGTSSNQLYESTSAHNTDSSNQLYAAATVTNTDGNQLYSSTAAHDTTDNNQLYVSAAPHETDGNQLYISAAPHDSNSNHLYASTAVHDTNNSQLYASTSSAHNATSNLLFESELTSNTILPIASPQHIITLQGSSQDEATQDTQTGQNGKENNNVHSNTSDISVLSLSYSTGNQQGDQI